MSFLTLFAAGKGVIGMGDKNSPYRMRAANLLPKFESTKNPFAPKLSEAKPLQTPELIAMSQATVDEAVKAKPALMETGSLFDAAPAKPAIVLMPAHKAEKFEIAPAVAPVIAAPIGQKTVAPLEPANPVPSEKPNASVIIPLPSRYSFTAWMKKFKALARFPRFGSSHPKPVVRPKQVELSLEKVRVVRNHLNDADLEIKGAGALEKKSALAAKLQPLASGHTKTLDRLTTRFFGASSNQLQTHAQCQITTTIQ